MNSGTTLKMKHNFCTNPTHKKYIFSYSWIIFSSFVSLKMRRAKNCCLMCQEVRERARRNQALWVITFSQKNNIKKRKKKHFARGRKIVEKFIFIFVTRAHEKNSHFASCCFFTFFDRFMANSLCTHKKNSSDIMKCSQHRKWSFYCIENLKRIEMGLKIVMSQAKSRISNCVEAGKFSLLS